MGRRPRRDAMAGRHSSLEKTPAALSDAKRPCHPSVRVAPSAPMDGTGHWALGSGLWAHRAAVAASLSWPTSPSASSDTMCQGAALMAWWDWGLAGEGLKIGRSQGSGCRRRAAERGEKQRRTRARHQAPRAAGPGDLPRGKLSHLGASYGLGPDSRCRVADLHAPVWGIALGWRRQGGRGKMRLSGKEKKGRRTAARARGNADACPVDG